MQIAVEIKPQERARLIRRAFGVRRNGFGKTQRVQIERGDEGVNEAHRIIRCDVILKRLGQEQRLPAIHSTHVIHG